MPTRDRPDARRACLAALLLALGVFVTATHAAEPPRLVLQITVDQLRGDMLPRFRDRFGAGGFKRLMEQGAWYANAHYGTGNTFTASGHAVLVTGADTAEHGIVANSWFDRALGRRISCTFDSEHGASPRNLGSTTVADELVVASGGQSRAFAVAGKDRSAIIPAGRRGTAYWYDDKTGLFGHSSWYGAAPPAWVKAWNDAHPAAAYRGREWTPLEASRRGFTPRMTANEHARPTPAIGRTFPHKLPDLADRGLFEALPELPVFDEYTLAFVRELMLRENLGRGPATDYLSVSLSQLDYTGHGFGPNSLEYADSLLRLDTTLAGFLAFVDDRVGAGRSLIVLSADHGVDEIPEVRSSERFDAGRFYPDKLREQMNRAMATRFGVTADLVAGFVPPGLYLDRGRIAALKLDFVAVEAALATEMRTVSGVAHALTRSDLLAGRLPDTALMRRMQRAFHPERSGDVVIVQKQFWYLYSEAECCGAMHGSPYSYDTHVPVIFTGAGIAPAAITRAVEPASVAPTIAALLGIEMPSGSSAPVLDELAIPR
jgi:predicted AlkP superfamily pyrophosphatase or phosphodiesterase